jgi:hypothetical protein
MATFSKNGKPMGRTPATAENKNKQWSKEEDVYLALALREGISASDVAARLGRTKNSVYFRKLSLGLEGVFTRGKRTNKHEPKSKLVQNKQQKVQSQSKPQSFEFVNIFQLESGVPVPQRGAKANEEERESARNVFSRMNPGQSFVVPRRLVHVVRHLANKEFESYKIKASAIGSDKKFFRIFRLA